MHDATYARLAALRNYDAMSAGLPSDTPNIPNYDPSANPSRVNSGPNVYTWDQLGKDLLHGAKGIGYEGARFFDWLGGLL